MTITPEIRAALENDISSVTNVPAITYRAWENVKFEPQTGQTWIRMNLVPFSSRPVTMGTTPQILHTGLFVVDVFTPAFDGPREADELADYIRSHYNVTTSLTYGTTTVRIRYSERGVGVVDEPWYHVPVRVEWYVYES